MSYHLTYLAVAHPEGIERGQVPPGHGACDCLLLGSIIGVPGGPGPASYYFTGLDGTVDKPLTDDQLFHVWVLLAHHLAGNLGSGGRRALCADVFETVRKATLAGTQAEPTATPAPAPELTCDDCGKAIERSAAEPGYDDSIFIAILGPDGTIRNATCMRCHYISENDE